MIHRHRSWFRSGLLFAIVTLTSSSFASSNRVYQVGDASDIFYSKLHRLTSSGLLQPLLLKKAQLSAVLEAFADCKHRVDETISQNNTLMRMQMPKLDQALKLAKEGKPTPQALLKDIQAASSACDSAREITARVNVDQMLGVVKKVCDRGQLKVMANELHPADYGITTDPDKVSYEQRIELFVRYVLLDPDAHQILIDLYKIAED
ncbi:MAG: hypothetical protein JSS72_06220 [Armatimonadetes bacterium]|nr:hypothetical protein [Armatimonadota bacterium]